MRVDVAETRGHMLIMKSVRGAPDTEIMLCRPGIPLVKTKEFLIFNGLKLVFMDRCHPACFSRQSEKLIAVTSIKSMINSNFTEPQGHKYRKLAIRTSI